MRGDVAGHQAEQRRLPGPVGADERHLGAVSHPERDVGEQAPTIRKEVADPVDVDVSHGHRVWPFWSSPATQIPGSGSGQRVAGISSDVRPA